MKRPWAAWLAVVMLSLGLVAGAVFWLMQDTTERRRVERSGPPAVVQWGDTRPALWLLTRQEEQVRQGKRSVTRLRFELHGHDVETAERLWSRHLLTVSDPGRTPAGHILGQHGPVVWLFLNDQPVAVSHRDGSVVGDAQRIVERNPGLAPMWPREPGSFAFDDRLIVTTADALHWEVDSQSLTAGGYRPEDEQRFAKARHRAGNWNGSFQTKDFGTRHLRSLDERWFGLYTEREAGEAANDGFGSNFQDPDRVTDDGKEARRRFWLARIGKTRAFSEGRHDRIEALTPVPDSPLFLQGALLKASGLREAFAPGADGGAIVMHRTRIDAQGQLVLSRLGPQFEPRWKTELPITELLNRWELPGRLLMLGSAPPSVEDDERSHELLLSLNLDDGSLRQFDLQRFPLQRNAAAR